MGIIMAARRRDRITKYLFVVKPLITMTRDYKQIMTDSFSRIEVLRTERPSAGTKFRLMGVAADIVEVLQVLREDLLERVQHEAVLDADAEVDFAAEAEKVLGLELAECEGQDEALGEQTRLVNEALGELHNTLEEIACQMERHHSDAEFVRLYENEKRRYIGSGTYGRARKTFDEWKDNQCYGSPGMEEIDDYRLEKVMLMFEKGVFRERVEHMQRAKRYPGELDFEQLTDNPKVSKTVYHHYAVLRKLADWRDGMLVVNPARAGQFFYASRHEDNAKSNRTNFLKYMHKVAMVQEEYRKLQDARTEGDESSPLPDVLATGMALKYWKMLQQAGFADGHCQLLPTTTRKQAMYIADVFSDKLQMRSKWKPFQELWHINNLAQEKWEMQETGKSPARSDEIDAIFAE